MNPPADKLFYRKEGSRYVRMKGLEPPRLAAPDPKSGAAANYATSALFFFERLGSSVEVGLCPNQHFPFELKKHVFFLKGVQI